MYRLFGVMVLLMLVPGKGLTSTSQGCKDFNDYAVILLTMVDSEGMVNYQKIKSEPKHLQKAIESQSSCTPDQLAALSDDQQIAYWINVYNMMAIKTVIDHYPIPEGGFFKRMRYPTPSIQHIDGVWDEIKHPTALGEITLDHIEHQILRVQFKEPRIHMALVCASISCPKLRREPYEGPKLNNQLKDQTTSFVVSKDHVQFDPNENRIYISKIFDWFEDDFEHVRIKIKSLSANYSEGKAGILQLLFDHNAPIPRSNGKRVWNFSYLDYNWGLNDQASPPQQAEAQ